MHSIPHLQLEGLQAPYQNQNLQPYDLKIHFPRLDTTLRTTAIPVKAQRRPAGTLLVVSPPQLVRPTQRRNTGPWSATYTFEDLVGLTDQFVEMLDLARQAALHDFPVLLRGESGTGKELLAQAIHVASARNGGPFVPVNCGASSDELLAAELFGYAEGAFTGAVRGGRKGKFELAHQGTLFLDEVESMSPKMQVSLLRLLEEGRISRVGAERPIQANVRVIAASQNLTSQAVEEGRFRLDLYHRLAVVPIRLPPLRERGEDIPQLARHLLNQLGFTSLQIDMRTIRTLKKYDWPGNIRELRNVLLRSAHRAKGDAILPHHLPSEVQRVTTQLAAGGSIRETEQALIRHALTKAKGNVAHAAAHLGIHRVTLYRKMKRYRIVSPQKP